MDFKAWCGSLDLSEAVVAVLAKEGFNDETALLAAEESDIEALKLPRGQHAKVRAGIRDLQAKHGTAAGTTSASAGVMDQTLLATLLTNLNINKNTKVLIIYSVIFYISFFV